MPTFSIHFSHDHGYSEKDVEAASLQDAMEKAKAIEVGDADFIGHYECSLDVEYIRVLDADDNELCWDHPDCIRDHAAQDLLEAAEALLNSVSAWGDEPMGSEHLVALDGLRRAVSKARGVREVPVSRNPS